MQKIAVTRRTVLRTALATAALATTSLTAPFVRRVQAEAAVAPQGKLTLAWHTNIAARWLDPQQHDGTATPDSITVGAGELFTASGNDVQVVVGQVAPLRLDLALELLPISFNAIPVHIDLLGDG